MGGRERGRGEGEREGEEWRVGREGGREGGRGESLFMFTILRHTDFAKCLNMILYRDVYIFLFI